MPLCDFSLDKAQPGLLWPWWGLEKRQWRRQTILETENLEMIAPCGGVSLAHGEDILDYFKNCCCRITPDVVEECEGVYVENSLHRKFTKEEVKCRYRGGIAEL